MYVEEWDEGKIVCVAYIVGLDNYDKPPFGLRPLGNHQKGIVFVSLGLRFRAPVQKWPKMAETRP